MSNHSEITYEELMAALAAGMLERSDGTRRFREGPDEGEFFGPLEYAKSIKEMIDPDVRRGFGAKTAPTLSPVTALRCQE